MHACMHAGSYDTTTATIAIDSVLILILHSIVNLPFNIVLLQKAGKYLVQNHDSHH